MTRFGEHSGATTTPIARTTRSAGSTGRSLEKHADVQRFVSLLCARRRLRDTEHERQRISLCDMLKAAKKAWHGVKLNQPDWGENSHSVALSAELRKKVCNSISS